MTTSFAHDNPQLAATYDRTSNLQFEGGKRLVERLGLEEGARVLDVGCGTGRLAQWIAERLGPKGSVANFFRIVPEDLRPSLRADLASAFDQQRGTGGVVVRGWGVLLVATRV